MREKIRPKGLLRRKILQIRKRFCADNVVSVGLTFDDFVAAVAAASMAFALVLMTIIVENVAIIVIVATAIRVFETLFEEQTVTKCVKSGKCDTDFCALKDCFTYRVCGLVVFRC